MLEIGSTVVVIQFLILYEKVKANFIVNYSRKGEVQKIRNKPSASLIISFDTSL